MSTLYLCGAGNSEGVRLALTVNQHLRRWEELVLLDDDSAKHGLSLCGVRIAGPFDLLADADPGSAEVANLVARTTSGRRGAARKIAYYRLGFVSLVAPDVNTGAVTLPGADLIVYQHATLGPEVSIGRGSVVFMGAVVGHESRVGEYCVIAANAVINARVQLGDGVYVGSNATILPEVRVGEGATIGAGSVVIQDVPAGATVMGVPAQLIFGPGDLSRARDSVAAHTAPAFANQHHPSPARARLEETISGIWLEVLGANRVGLEDNFFDLGGTSLLVLQVQELIHERIGAELASTDMFRFTTVRALAEHLDRHVPTGSGGTGWMRAQFRRAVMLGRRGELAT